MAEIPHNLTPTDLGSTAEIDAGSTAGLSPAETGADSTSGATCNEVPRSTSPEQKKAAQETMLENRLRKRYRHLRKWARRDLQRSSPHNVQQSSPNIETAAFRLYDRDIPEIPLVLDIYGDSIAGALYERPYEKDPHQESLWLRAMEGAISRALDIPRDRIFLKERGRQRGKSQYEKIPGRPVIREISEGGLRFRVNLSDYLDTGLFLDHRKTRSLVRAAAGGKRVLNLFCYTASFSVYAAAGGALAVDSVDMSNTYLDWAAANFALNGLEARRVTPRDLLGNAALPPCRLIRAEAIRFLEGAAEAGLRWDQIILDPPAFSNSKKMNGVLDLRRDHGALITSCLRLLAPGGTLWFSANIRNFNLESTTCNADFSRKVPHATCNEVPRAEFPGIIIEDIREKIRDEDFRGKRLPATYTFTPTV